MLTVQVALLRRRLKKLSEPPPGVTDADLVDYCYNMRGFELDQIKGRSKLAPDDFRELVHYIGRLGATRSSTRAVVQGMIEVPALRQISCIRTVNAPSIREVKTNEDAMSPYEIVRGICQDSASQNPLQNRIALHNLVELDLPSENTNLRGRLASRSTIVTRVHAELQIADRFSRDWLAFVDDDKYIGCSKPACYFCFEWLSSHKHGYVLPTTHSKIIIGCRGPDSGLNEAGAAVLRDMYAKMCTRVGQDILDVLLKSGPEDVHSNHLYQSTEGSSYAQSRI